MIEEIIMVRDAFNAQEFDAINFKNSPNNSIKTDRILAFMLLASCSIVVFMVFREQQQKKKVFNSSKLSFVDSEDSDLH